MFGLEFAPALPHSLRRSASRASLLCVKKCMAAANPGW